MQHIYEVVETSFKYPIKGWVHQFNQSKIMRPHWHEEIELIYCYEGSFELLVDGEKEFFKRDSLVLINSNSIHKLSFLTDQTKLITLLLSVKIFETFNLNNCNFDLSILKDNNSLKKLVIYLGEHLNEENLIIHNRMFLLYEMILKDCCCHYENKNNVKMPIIKQIIDYLEQHYMEELNLRDLAKYFHFSEVYLSRMFKEKTGITLSHYLNKTRLNHAYNDLMNTTMTINEIALNHGFKNVKAFNKVFREYYHEVPSKYRRG